MNNFQKRLTNICIKACKYEETKSITTAVEVAQDLAEWAKDVAKVAELIGG